MTHQRLSRSVARASQSGVALIEVLVSVLLFSLGILGLIGLQTRAIGLSLDAEDRNRAALIANDIAATMWTTRTVAIDPDVGEPSWNDRASNPQAGGLPGGTVQITSDVAANTADILITWRPPQRPVGQQDSRLTTRVALPPP
ncbi:type IV pilus modification protein PilV [Variovorax paradoxus]|jgi:type IV pilus assembly protein PilV|uniref:type IV pilus modification protein PilV n=1 Tax=Variovorax paradoxus TaxID=34073 RepID=UPI00247FD1EE|nr:type IV pilus modification protein PilV [Variovorax paradoxus]WGT63797.1 type IV pilus modification protein PilV [Variovorax paradoxus]